MLKVQRALISVSDKRGVLEFAKILADLNVEILSTGGTGNLLRDNGITVIDVSEYTNFPEMLEGRLKTLHPKVHGAILAVRGNKEHMDQIKKQGIQLIDMVVVNLYPFENVIKKNNVSLEEAIENIDIGGPTMLRAAAKNYKDVAVVSNPDIYEDVSNELQNNKGLLSEETLFNLALGSFQCTAAYDDNISIFLKTCIADNGDDSKFPEETKFDFKKAMDLRYGENPHQSAAFYKTRGEDFGFGDFQQLNGKELSFNNIYDLSSALDFVKDFDDPTAVIVKHNNPTGIAQNENLAVAYRDAHRCDPTSAFGGIIGVSRDVDKATAELILESGFMECVIATGFKDDALNILRTKKNLRLIKMNFSKIPEQGFDSKKVSGGVLLQEKDSRHIDVDELKVVTDSKPSQSEIDSMVFGWRIIKNVKSNAIVLVKGRKAVGIGCGQTSRIEAVNIAITKAGKNAEGSVMISDAFLPHIDNVQLASKAGVSAIIQTGGSITDDKVIAEANKWGIAMVFSGIRHFKH